tara:strand:- start:510 stop:1013 length:504 start_codon:yes stop_codon:yes gene_type:complete
MAETKLRQYAVIERLGKMDVDLIDVDLVTDTDATADNGVISNPVEIANAVSVNAGTSILQSVQLIDDDDDGAVIDLVFTQVSTNLGTVNGAIDAADSVAASILGVVSITSYFDGIAWQIAQKTNIGLVLKAAASTKSIYVGAINRNGGAVTKTAADDLHLRLGIVKD